MASELYNLAARAIRQAALKDFRKTTLGRLMGEISSAAGRGSLAPEAVKQFSRRLSLLTSDSVTRELMKSLGLGDVERYAKEIGGEGRSFFDDFRRGFLSPLGRLIRSFSSPRSTGGRVSIDRELQAATALLKSFGHVVLPPPGLGGASKDDQRKVAAALKSMGWRVAEPREQPAPIAPRKQRLTTDVDFGRAKLRNRVRNEDPLVSGKMVDVQSSNVHSIGFRIDPDSAQGMHQSTGTLLIRFLDTDGSGKRSGMGPLYEYYDVPAALFQQFRRAASKGKFVWDRIRVRGTVAGHRFSYSLADIVRDYVPRQAGIKRGSQGEFYMTRRFRDSTGRLLTSRLPEEQVRASGFNYTRGEPNRGTPNRGTPNRGR